MRSTDPNWTCLLVTWLKCVALAGHVKSFERVAQVGIWHLHSAWQMCLSWRKRTHLKHEDVKYQSNLCICLANQRLTRAFLKCIARHMKTPYLHDWIHLSWYNLRLNLLWLGLKRMKRWKTPRRLVFFSSFFRLGTFSPCPAKPSRACRRRDRRLHAAAVLAALGTPGDET